MSESGIEMRIVGLKQEEWDNVQRVGYDSYWAVFYVAPTET